MVSQYGFQLQAWCLKPSVRCLKLNDSSNVIYCYYRYHTFKEKCNCYSWLILITITFWMNDKNMFGKKSARAWILCRHWSGLEVYQIIETSFKVFKTDQNCIPLALSSSSLSLSSLSSGHLQLSVGSLAVCHL